jgi:hypothetical protein
MLYARDEGQRIPDYVVLLNVWKLATKLQMVGLRVAVLSAMAERRKEMGRIPGTSLLVQAWKETEEGSGLRLMLITWAAEHSRFSLRFTPRICVVLLAVAIKLLLHDIHIYLQAANLF